MQRRQFIKTGIATAITTGLATGLVGNSNSSTNLAQALSMSLSSIPLDSKYLDTIGLQLWTVRNQLAENKKKTLEAVAKAGYKQVELMNTMDADDYTKIAADLGLKISSAFFDWTVIAKRGAKTPTADQVIEKAKSIGLKHLVFGYIGKGSRETADQYKKHAEASNKMGEKCKAAGIQLCYHNHSFEFAKLDGAQTGFDIFMKEFDKDLCKFEIDVFWVKIGGWDPIETMKKLKGRVSQVHLKDLLKETPVTVDEGKVPAKAFKELGNGTIDMAKILETADAIGVQQCHVEQDQSDDPIESIGTSMSHLKKIHASKK